MRTPAGKDCRHYFQDFHRGKHVQECRLIKDNPNSRAWKPADCTTCPVPSILLANASPTLALKLTVSAKLLGVGRQLKVTAECTRHHLVVDDPFVGCPACNSERPGLDAFLNALEETGGE